MTREGTPNFEKKYTRISAENPEYLERKGWAYKEDKVFGKDEIFAIEKLEREPGLHIKMSGGKERYLRWLERNRQGLRREWEDLGANDNSFNNDCFEPDSRCFRLVEEAYDNVELRSELEKLFDFGEMNRKEVSTDFALSLFARKLLDEFETGVPVKTSKRELEKARIVGNIAYDIFKKSGVLERLSNDFIFKVTKNHIDLFERKEKELQPKMEGYKDLVRQRIINAIDTGKLLPISSEIKMSKKVETKLKKRLEKIFKEFVFSIGDPVVEQMQDISGNCNIDNAEIAVSSRSEELWGLDATLAHEILHALSGKTVLRKDEKKDLFGGEYNISEYETQRLGLDYHVKGKRKFGWLNEALTENLVGVLGFRKLSYRESRELLDLIVRDMGGKKEVEPLFYWAYFEDFDPKLPQGQRIPYWKKLRQKMDEKLGSNFLLNLQNYIDHNRSSGNFGWKIGVEKAVTKYKKFGKDIKKWGK